MDEQEKARQELRQKYQAILRRLWRKPDDCPICESNAWNIGDLIQAPIRQIDQGLLGLVPPSQVYVYIPVTCLQCGYSIFFHTGVLDVRDQETVKSEGPLRLPPDP